MGLFGPSFESVWSSGAESPGVIVGIKVRQKGDDDSTYIDDEYAVQVDGELLGIRQKLSPRTEVRLGMPVTVARSGKAAVIKWGDAFGNRWKQVPPPALGIDDTESLGGITRGLGKPVTIEILSIGTRAGMFGLTTVSELQVRVTPQSGEPYEATIAKVYPAFYASHLYAVGKVLPGFDFAGKPRIDWESTAVAEPGVGVPSPFADTAAGAEALPGSVGLFDQMQNKLTEKVLGIQARAVGADLTAGPATDDPVTWEMYLAASVAIKNAGWGSPAQQDEIAQAHGIPAGEWDAANRRWQGRLMSDWRLGAAYGQAMS